MNTVEIRLIIADEIAKTELLIAEYEELTKPVAPDVAIGRVSRMDAINNKSVMEAALRQCREKLNKLNYALSKVESPDFGICMNCRNEIPLGRILIKPESVYCVRCAR
jgi:DnaK suppressor protein